MKQFLKRKKKVAKTILQNDSKLNEQSFVKLEKISPGLISKLYLFYSILFFDFLIDFFTMFNNKGQLMKKKETNRR